MCPKRSPSFSVPWTLLRLSYMALGVEMESLKDTTYAKSTCVRRQKKNVEPLGEGGMGGGHRAARGSEILRRLKLWVDRTLVQTRTLSMAFNVRNILQSPVVAPRSAYALAKTVNAGRTATTIGR